MQRSTYNTAREFTKNNLALRCNSHSKNTQIATKFMFDDRDIKSKFASTFLFVFESYLFVNLDILMFFRLVQRLRSRGRMDGQISM